MLRDFSQSSFDGLSQATIHWFRRHKRALPFRETRDPYAILVSELMLQQTQVQTVVPYYERFLARFPTVESLAQSSEDDVLRYWAGLGYYRRARLLQAAAKVVVRQYGGKFPRSLAALEQLPGVGRYTAGAVFSFAYNKPAPIVEANTARLFGRLLALDVPPGSSAGAKQLWQLAETLLPKRNARDHNYSLMELGALVCRPVPQCSECPLTAWCRAYQEERTAEIPVAAPKPEKLERHFVGVVAQAGNNYLVRQIPEGEWHHGLFSFPAIPVTGDLSPIAQVQALSNLLDGMGRLGDLTPFARLNYTVTRHRVALQVYRCTIARRRAQPSPPLYWRTLTEIAALPLSSPQRKLLDLVIADDQFFGNTNET